MLRFRLVSVAAIVAAACISVSVALATPLLAPLDQHNGHCLIVNSRTGQGYATLQAANDAATTLAGDALAVKGTCYGSSTLSKSLTIAGKGDATLNGGNAAAPVITVSSPGAGAVTVALNDVTVTGAANVGGLGGGVFNDGGTLTLNHTSVSGNTARLGGGILNYDGGRVTVDNSAVRDNDGPGIENYDGGVLAVNRSLIMGNRGLFGGGITNHFVATATVNNTLIVHNSATAEGGGIFNVGSLVLTNSVIVGNSAGSEGGGVEQNGALVRTNTIIAGNTPDQCVQFPAGC